MQNNPFDDIKMSGDDRPLYSIKLTFTGREAWALAQLCKRFRSHHAEALARHGNPEETQDDVDLMESAVAKVRVALDKIGASPR